MRHLWDDWLSYYFRPPWIWFLARFRLDLEAVCEASRGRGLHNDFHDYPDSAEGLPIHFVTLTCKRCGKTFTI
jgi:hypothetical protein